MKKIIICFLILVGFTACTNEVTIVDSLDGGTTTTPTDPTPTEESITATIDGTAWDGSAIIVAAVATATGTDSTVSISGANTEGQSVALRFVGPQEAGTYTEASGEGFSVTYTDSSSTIYTASNTTTDSSFSIVVTNFDTTNSTITGTFTATVVDDSGASLEITNGVFDSIGY